MYKLRLFFICLALSLSGCSLVSRSLSATPTVLSDSFFFGRAFIDTNANGRVDASDAPLPGALFSAVDSRGSNGGGFTDENGTAYAWWPGPSAPPVQLRMQPPEGYEPAGTGEAEIQLQAGETSADFLFVPQTEGDSNE